MLCFMTRKYNVLYVDDEPDNLLAFRSVFRRFFNVYTASGGPEAIDLLDEQSVDLILSDQRMPHMTGVELLNEVSHAYPAIIRMIVTGYSDMDPIIHAVKNGKVAQYITKPWKVEELKSILDEALANTA